jgi:hypothetical protein
MFDRIKTTNLKALNNSFKGKVATAEIDTRSEPKKNESDNGRGLLQISRRRHCKLKEQAKIKNATKQ